jgi:D-glycero-D-manno-heptose 1,7-bisphosphate phosphatase
MGVGDLTMHRAIFLDRDGVLNRAFIHDDGKAHPPASLDELEILPGVAQACVALRQAGFLLIVVTNQPDVARGIQRRDVVESINDALRLQIPLDDIRVCYHDDPDDCACRKPRPGLLLAAASDWKIDLTNSFMVGDRWKDIEAGRRAGCQTALIKRAYSETERCRPDFRAASLHKAAAWILKHNAELVLEGKKL